ncbi:ribonucleoside triphosphate reductase [Candidatus Bipolaricaulota bacterium]|nr:ribonucleoside triphosphate reductase [Candidatus Bipolaricaulota bacterium]
MQFIVKRDGRVVPFDQAKITTAVWKAMRSVGEVDELAAAALSDRVTTTLDGEFVGEYPTVEEIQDLVEQVLIVDGRPRVAKAYILYRKQHEDLREMRGLLDELPLVEDYLEDRDLRVRENSNMTFSLQGLNTHITDKIISRYWLGRIYPEAIRAAHVSGDFHVHDLGTLGAYCVGWDLRDLLLRGFRGVRGKVESRPAKHFRVALLHVVNFLYTLQGESAGAQAFSNLDTYLAPFIRTDGLTYDEVKQHLQEFIYNMNVPTRVGFQTPFTNVTLDLKVPSYMKSEPVIVGGVLQDSVYGDYQAEMDLFNRAYAEVMLAGDMHERPFTFPIPTYNITRDFDWENPVLDPVWEMTAKYGIPYFSNFVNSDMHPEDARSMCCRLRIDNRELRTRGGGLFGANPLTGSIGVVTLNLPRLGYLAVDRDDFFRRLGELMDLAKEALIIKRKTLESLTENGLYPYSQFYLRRIKEAEGAYWRNHFSTIGLIGMNEALLNLFGCTIDDARGREFALEVLNWMRDRIGEYQGELHDIFNLEATPAEGTSFRLAKIDRERFPDIRFYNTEIYGGQTPYYTNSTQLPVGLTDDLYDALRLQDPLQTRYTGGTVFHGFLGERMPSAEATKRAVRKIAETFHLPYYTLTPTFSICTEHGYVVGEHAHCPTCGSKAEVYSRIVGYFRPVEQWNDGKQAEFADRKAFVPTSAGSP